MLIFQLAEDMHEINYSRFPHFDTLFRPGATFEAALHHFSRTSEALREASEALQIDFNGLADVDTCI